MLVTMAQAKIHLHVLEDDDDTDANVALKLEQAEAIVVDYLKTPDHGWTALTVPEPVHAAILKVLEGLFDGPIEMDPISPAVVSLLMRYRDPAMA